MQFLVDCFIVVWHCVGGGGDGGGGGSGPQPAPEINATNSVAALALLLSVGAILYRRWQQDHH